jgi:hypothetical protein
MVSAAFCNSGALTALYKKALVYNISVNIRGRERASLAHKHSYLFSEKSFTGDL